MKIKNRYIIFFLLIVFFTINCKSNNEILSFFKPIYKTADIVLRINFIVRTTKIIPEKFFIQNLKTFEVFELKNYSSDIFYYDKIPLGVYRIGYWIANYKVNDIFFRIFVWSNFYAYISSEGKFNLGTLIYHCKADSLIIEPIKIKFINSDSDIKIDKFSYYNKNLEIQEKIMEKSKIFEKYRYGKALYNDNGEIEKSLFESFNIEKYYIEEYKKIIDMEKTEQDKLDLISGYKTIIDNINLDLKRIEILLKNKQFDLINVEFQNLLSIDQNLGEYYSFLGLINYLNKDINNAKENFYKSICLNTSFIFSYDLYAKILLEEGNIDMAKQLSDYSIEIEPDNIDFLLTNLNIYKKINNLKKIEQIKNRLSKLNYNDY